MKVSPQTHLLPTTALSATTRPSSAAIATALTASSDVDAARCTRSQVEQRPQEATDRLKRRLWGRQYYAADSRLRGIFDPTALTPEALRTLFGALRIDVEERNDEQALFEMVSLLVGLEFTHATCIPIGSATTDLPVVLDLEHAALRVDYAQTLMQSAAPPSANNVSLPATSCFLRALPAFCVAALRARWREHLDAATLGELCGAWARGPWEPIDGRRHGRLRTTAARALRAIGPFALRLGIDRYHASLITGSPEVCGRSRLYYTRSDPRRLAADTNLFFEALGLGSAHPIAVTVPFGSAAVPADENVLWCVRQLASAANALRPARRYQTCDLIEFHNACVRAWAFSFSFLLGLREQRALDLCASRLRPGVQVMEVRDKLSGQYKRLHPVYLGPLLEEQVALIWAHLSELHRRVRKIECLQRFGWFAHLERVLAAEPVPLLFVIDGRRADPVGTAHFQRVVPPEQRLAPNAGRHYWQTHFYDEGLPTEAIEHWARHSTSARELATSRSVVSLETIAATFLSAQHIKVQQLGLSVLPGLVRRVTRV